MRFELEPSGRGATPEEIRDDIRRVAIALHRTALTATEYRRHGRYSPDVARSRFGSWLAALSAAGLEPTRTMAVSREDCLNDLTAVAEHLGKRSVTIHEYLEHGRYSDGPFNRHFGSWFSAVDAAGLERSRTLGVTNEEYFANLNSRSAANRSSGPRPEAKPQVTGLRVSGNRELA